MISFLVVWSHVKVMDSQIRNKLTCVVSWTFKASVIIKEVRKFHFHIFCLKCLETLQLQRWWYYRCSSSPSFSPSPINNTFDINFNILLNLSPCVLTYPSINKTQTSFTVQVKNKLTLVCIYNDSMQSWQEKAKKSRRRTEGNDK